jgi:hypothetical protein
MNKANASQKQNKKNDEGMTCLSNIRQSETTRLNKPFRRNVLIIIALMFFSVSAYAIPTSGSGQNTAANPNGALQITVPASTFTNIAVSTDPTNTITAIKIIAFPIGVTSVVINGTSYTLATFPAAGVTVPANASGAPTQTITVNPIVDGVTTAVIPFKAIAAGVESANTGIAVFSLTGVPVIPCATKELMADTRFIFTTGAGSTVPVNGLSFNGWTGIGSGNVDIDNKKTYIYDNVNTETFTHPFTGVNSLGSGAVISINLGIRNGVVNGGGSGPITDWGEATVLTVKYGGVIYATVTTDGTTGAEGRIATIKYFNSATGSLPDSYTFDYGPTPQSFNHMNLVDWQIYLPASIPNNGSLVVEFNPGGVDANDAADDFKIGAVSLKACVNAVPVKLENFSGKKTKCNSTELNWKISNAINFDHFEVERSFNDGAFQTRAIVSYNAASADYLFKENNLPAGRYQYRLKMADADGRSEYSSVVFMKVDCEAQNAISIYPNPAKDKITITGLNTGELITIYNVEGQAVYSRKAANYQQNADVSNLATGNYFILVTDKNGEKISTSKIIKIN